MLSHSRGITSKYTDTTDGPILTKVRAGIFVCRMEHGGGFTIMK